MMGEGLRVASMAARLSQCKAALQAAEARAEIVENRIVALEAHVEDAEDRVRDADKGWGRALKSLSEERARAERLEDALQDMYDNFSPPDTVDPRSHNDVDKAAAHARAYALLSSVPSAGQEGKL